MKSVLQLLATTTLLLSFQTTQALEATGEIQYECKGFGSCTLSCKGSGAKDTKSVKADAITIAPLSGGTTIYQIDRGPGKDDMTIVAGGNYLCTVVGELKD